MDLSAEMNK